MSSLVKKSCFASCFYISMFLLCKLTFMEKQTKRIVCYVSEELTGSQRFYLWFDETHHQNKYLRHLGKEADGQRQRQAEGGEAHEAVDRQDEPPPPLQDRKSGGTKREWPKEREGFWGTFSFSLSVVRPVSVFLLRQIKYGGCWCMCVDQDLTRKRLFLLKPGFSLWGFSQKLKLHHNV